MSASSRVAAPCAEGVPGRYVALVPAGTQSFRWVSRAMLWRARRDTTARLLGDPSLRRRPRLLRRRELAAIDRTDLTAPSFAVLGDPGEGDGSQYAVVPGLLGAAGDTDFLVIASDVVYPAGGVKEYEPKFFAPYRDYEHPIYAVPGNHDWYDGLRGFDWCFAGAPSGRVRAERRREPVQPGPYWCLDTRPLRIVGIDTGILGTLDRDQGSWLHRVAGERDVPKVLVAGTPLYRNGAINPGPIQGGGSVLDVVHDPANGFVAVLAGDVHNYQRYPVALPDGRTIQHIVCGGGGAYTNATHTIPRVDLPGVGEADVRLYPLRGDSLSWFAGRFEAWAAGQRRRRIPSTAISPDAAAAIMAERLGLEPIRPSARATRPTAAEREAALHVFPAAGMSGLNRFADQYYDTDDPPFTKHLLRVDVRGHRMTIRCLAATGRLEHEVDPPVEDTVTLHLP